MVMNEPFKIDFRKFVLMMLPMCLRKPVLYHFIYRLLVPWVTIYRSFYQSRLTDNFFAKYDSSIGNIERMLNILFPTDDDGIKIELAETAVVIYDYIYITDEIETNSAIVGETYIDTPIEQRTFNLTIPAELSGEREKIIETAKKYILPGYGFNVIDL